MKKMKLLGAIVLIICVNNIAYAQSGQHNRNREYEGFNPSYHFYPSGDPTGLFYYAGKYYNQWGNASSVDFVHWDLAGYGIQRANYQKIQRDPLISQAVKDSLARLQVRLGGSGTIVVDWNNTSGFGKDGNPPLLSFWHNQGPPWNTQMIGLAYSNDTARTWTRYEKYPILDINSREFRDPKIFWYEPDKKWIMAIGWAEIPKVKFFSSQNLKDWEFMSDFGPWGAVGGVWECVEFFPLPVDGDPTKMKWVLAISVQPLTGQYFIGDFDGKRFTLDPDFVQVLTYEKYRPAGDVLFDFERGIDAWEMEGDAFLESPSSQALLRQGAIMGKEGLFFINSAHNQASATGKITSPLFKVTKDYINFLVGGGFVPTEESINLLVNGKIVRSQTGNNSGGMQWASWDVSEFKGEQASIQIIDNLNSREGYIYADHIMLSDEPAKNQLEKAFWFDYGTDFFAVRSWNNYAENEKRRIWVGWMGSWRYASVEPVRGIQSIPRSVELKTFPEGVRLVQKPIVELESLRTKHLVADENIFEGIWIPKKFIPSKNVYELMVEFENISAKEFGLKVCVGNNQQTVIGYSIQSEELFVDRRDSGLDEFSGLFPRITRGPLKNRTKTIKLHIFIDKSSLEVFGNDGETVISSKIYPDQAGVGIELFSNLGKVKVKSLELWELAPLKIE